MEIECLLQKQITRLISRGNWRNSDEKATEAHTCRGTLALFNIFIPKSSLTITLLQMLSHHKHNTMHMHTHTEKEKFQPSSKTEAIAGLKQAVATARVH